MSSVVRPFGSYRAYILGAVGMLALGGAVRIAVADLRNHDGLTSLASWIPWWASTVIMLSFAVLFVWAGRRMALWDESMNRQFAEHDARLEELWKTRHESCVDYCARCKASMKDPL